MKKVLLSLAMLLLVACAGNRAVSENQVPVGQASAAGDAGSSYYTTQLEVLKKGSIEDAKATDWLKFRKDYLKIKLAKSNQGASSKVTGALSAEMNKSLQENNFAAAAKSAKELLAANYTNMYAHYVITMDTTADSATIAFHNEVAKGLFESIYNSGRGISEETALYVIDVSEEYDFLGFMGFKPEGQSLIERNGHYYDLMEASNGKTGEAKKYYKIYFDVTDFFGHY